MKWIFYFSNYNMLFSHKYRYTFILLLALYSYFNTIITEVFDYYPIKVLPIYVVVDFMLIAAIIWEGNHILQYVLPKQLFIFKKEVHFLLVQFIASLPISFIAGLLPTYVIATYFLNYSNVSLILSLKLSLAFGFRVSLFLHSLNVIFYYVVQYQQKRLETEEFKRISTQSQLQSLKSQINPHFLFNNLNVLSSLILQDNNSANEFVERFAKVYRYVLKSHEKELVGLNDEVEFIKSYLYLLQKRFGNNLQIDINIADIYLEYYIIPVALQMLVENAIKHNIVSQKKPLLIHIYIETANTIVVSNSLQKKILDENDSTQIGLKNIIQRYQLLSKKTVEVIEAQNYFTVKLPLLELSN
jgi:two-component system, LytTR family, sensor kinase